MLDVPHIKPTAPAVKDRWPAIFEAGGPEGAPVTSLVDTNRKRLPNRRPSTSFDFEQGGLRFTCTYSECANGRLAEVFLQNHKPGSQSDMNARDSAIAASLALQHGCSFEELRRPLPDAASPLAAALGVIAETMHTLEDAS